MHAGGPKNPGSDFGSMGAFGGADDDDELNDGTEVVPSVGNTGEDIQALFDDEEGTSSTPGRDPAWTQLIEWQQEIESSDYEIFDQDVL